MITDRIDDWLNPPYSAGPRPSSSLNIDTSTSDFRFTYIGPSGTYTPLHRDVYSSYSWSCNILGRKVWWLFPPDRVEHLLKNGEPIFDVREVGDEGGGIKVVQEVCPFFFPHTSSSPSYLLAYPYDALEKLSDIFCVSTIVEGSGADVQEGEVIWVPSGWYHQVLNLDFVCPLRYHPSICPPHSRVFAHSKRCPRPIDRYLIGNLTNSVYQ
jgi:hypothetical protein